MECPRKMPYTSLVRFALSRLVFSYCYEGPHFVTYLHGFCRWHTEILTVHTAVLLSAHMSSGGDSDGAHLVSFLREEPAPVRHLPVGRRHFCFCVAAVVRRVPSSD